MARPLSEEKRQALLEAACDFVARLGTEASTAKIAKAAGVSEGTLFTYFPTKDDLLNQLFIAIETDLMERMLAPYSDGDAPRDRLRRVWDRLVDWGLTNSTARKAVRQLKVSDRVTAQSRQKSKAMVHDARAIVAACLTGHADPERIDFYIDTIVFGLAEITINAIAANPKQDENIRQSGFDLLWKGTAA
ncbi:TetR family transcriptional regulator [Pararhizobium polonicum]|uniref:TetR family transcriptional regulator n=1 Tax=Pararhizobium polonicum TaxID=1612624 RepID=A0A1C7NWS5_9HYPH|nr:TetR/AcrR family transcriptional regulator [Pararhizobium polonicum]OBZ93477.1 TetR family transcriptional regulator [Pararhizobium polonicum]